MPFRIQNIKELKGNGYNSVTKYVTDEVTGIKEEKTEIANKELPRPELFTLKNQLAAGVEMKEMNSKIVQDTKTNIGKKIEKAMETKEKGTEEKGE